MALGEEEHIESCHGSHDSTPSDSPWSSMADASESIIPDHPDQKWKDPPTPPPETAKKNHAHVNVRFVVEPVTLEAETEITGARNQSTDPADNQIIDHSHSISSADRTWTSTDYAKNIGSDLQTQLTVRSMASIGLGSSNGKKIHLRRVHTTGGESLASPLLSPLPATENGGSSPWSVPIKIRVDGDEADDDSSSSDSEEVMERRRRLRHNRLRRQGIWNNRMEFLLACIGLAVGLGNVWRFPYIAYKSGGGAFLLPYALMVFFCGVPLLIMELAIGQYTREGPVDALRAICPILSGVGIGMVFLSLLLSSYYSVVMSWAVYYLGSSFTDTLPWTHCNNTWNTEACYAPSLASVANRSFRQSAWRNSTIDLVDESIFKANQSETIMLFNWTMPIQEFFDKQVLQVTTKIEDMGDIRWELVGGLLLAWILLYVTLQKSVRWSGKAVYFTATVPYLLLITLMVRTLTLEGANDGLKHFFHPDWSLLSRSEVWVNALAQSFTSMGIGYGCLVAFASYNRFHGPIVRDAFCLSALNSVTSLVAGIIAFGTLGHLSMLYQAPIEQVANDGPGFALVMYTYTVSKMPFPPLWAVLFFLSFICLGLDTQFATVEVVILSIQGFLKQTFKREINPQISVFVICCSCLIGALPYVTQGGIYLVQLADYYIATAGVIYLALGEVIAVGTLFGASRLGRKIREMTAHRPSPFLVICWAGISPLIITGICIFQVLDYSDPHYNHGSYIYPSWSSVLGWSVLTLLLIAIPLMALVAVYQASGKTICKKVVNATKSPLVECPCCRRGLNALKDTHSEVHLSSRQDVNNQDFQHFTFARFAEFTLPDDTIHTLGSLPSSRPPIPAEFQNRRGEIEDDNQDSA